MFPAIHWVVAALVDSADLLWLGEGRGEVESARGRSLIAES